MKTNGLSKTRRKTENKSGLDLITEWGWRGSRRAELALLHELSYPHLSSDATLPRKQAQRHFRGRAGTHIPRPAALPTQVSSRAVPRSTASSQRPAPGIGLSLDRARLLLVGHKARWPHPEQAIQTANTTPQAGLLDIRFKLSSPMAIMNQHSTE